VLRDCSPNKVSALLTHHQTRHAPCLCTVIDTPPRHGQDRRRRRTAPGDDISTTVSSSLCEPRDVHVGCRTCWCAISLHQRPPRHGMTSPPLVDCHRGLHIGRWPPRRGLGPAHHCQEHDHTRDHLLSAARTDWRASGWRRRSTRSAAAVARSCSTSPGRPTTPRCAWGGYWVAMRVDAQAEHGAGDLAGLGGLLGGPLVQRITQLVQHAFQRQLP
jgi:hypothetical protein